MAMGVSLQKRMHTPIIPSLEKKSKPPSSDGIGRGEAFPQTREEGKSPWRA